MKYFSLDKVWRISRKFFQALAGLFVILHFCVIKGNTQIPKSFTYFTQVQGLPDNNVRALEQDKYGYIWVGTENGLARFDGKYFSSFELYNSLVALPSREVFDLQNIDSNHLAVVTRLGLQIINVQNMTSVNLIIPKGSLAYEDKANRLRRIHVTDDGEIIIVSRSGFYHFSKDRKLIFRHDDYTFEESLGGLSFGEYSYWLNDESLVLAGNKAIYKYNTQARIMSLVKPGDKSFLLFNMPNLKANNSKYFVLQPSKGCFVFLNYDSDSLVYIDEAKKRITYLKTGIGSIKNKFTWRSKVFFLDDSTLLLSGKFHGLYTLKLDPGKGSMFLDTSANFDSKKCNAFFLDKRNKWWLGFNDGLAIENISAINLQLHPAASLYESKSNRNSVLQSAVTDNYVYGAATVSGGIHQFNKSTLEFERTIPFDFKAIGNQSLYTVEHWMGDTIVCGGERGLFLFEESHNSATYIQLPDWKETNNWVSDLFVDHNQNLWISCNKPRGCYVWKKGESLPAWFSIDSNYQKVFKEVYHFAEDKEGNIWLTGNGILRYNIKTKNFDFFFDRFSAVKSEPTPVSAIAVDDNGLVWVANGTAGLACVEPLSRKILFFGLKHGLLDESIKDLIHIDGFVYVTSKNGIVKINCETKKISVVSTIKDVYYQNYFSDKLTFDKTTQSFFTGAGSSVIKFQSSASGKIPNDPRLLMVFVKWGKDSIRWFPTDGITVNWKDRNVTLFYNGINFEDADYQRYAYRTVVNGKASDWIMQNDQQRITLSNLDKGTTGVEIKLFSPQNAWPPETIYFPIHVITPFWKATWFYLLCLSFFVAVVFFIFRYKDNQRKKILEIRSNISKDLHDEIGSTLSGIAMYSNIVKNSVDNNEADAAKYAANIIQDSAAEMVYKLNDVIWLINPDKGSLQDLIDKLTVYAQKLCHAKNMKADVQVKGELDYLKLPIGTRRNIYLFCREAINNGAKYSKATILSMEVILHANILKIIIQDNGVGFDMSNVKRGNGLDNMLKRADEMGADVEIQSAPLQGCTILFGLKITQ